MISVSCPACECVFRIADEQAGQVIPCPDCGKPVAHAPSTWSGNPPPLEPSELAASFSAAAEAFPFLAPAQAPDELGRLGPFRVLDLLDQGGMGIVFRAQDVLLNRFVALKVMAPSAAAIPNNRARFFREARAAAAIQHDHIVAIYHVGEDQGVPYITMPLLRGESLAARLLREVKLPVREIIRIGRELAEGLAAAHEQGLIHRDIKPANIWLEEPGGRVKVLDFGLARVTGETVELTYQGALVGTPSYMSPEQGRGERAEALSDLFSLGSVLYHMATGMPPFRGANAHDILTALATETPPPIVELDPTLPPDLSKVIAHLLARKPSDRPTAAAVAKMLREVSVEGPPAIPSAGRRRWWPVLIGAAVIAALVLAVVFRFLL